jgi:hypothetical protein
MNAHLPTLAIALASLALGGCSTSNPNPPTPRANTGYVDFYTDSSLGLTWEIKCAEEGNVDQLRTVFSKMEPVPGTTLRLASSPGLHQYQVWIMNRVTAGPQPVQIQVENGKVTPVHVTLSPVSTNSVQSKKFGFRPSAKGYGRGTKIVSEESEVYDINAAAGSPQPYQSKESMPYSRP